MSGPRPPHSHTHTAARGGPAQHAHSHGGHHAHSHGGGGHHHHHNHTHGEEQPQQQQQQRRPAEMDKSGGEDLAEARHYVEVLAALNSYGTDGFQRFHRAEHDFMSADPAYRELVPGMAEKFRRIRGAIVQNHRFIKSVLANRAVFQNGKGIDYEALLQQTGHPSRENMSKVRSTLLQVMRDWSDEGAAERAQCYGPILDEFRRLFPDPASRRGKRVLVPGCGLARLAWDLASLGFAAQGNEFSYFMLLVSFTVLNASPEPRMHALHPFVSQTNNCLSVDDQVRGVLVPDVRTAELPEGSDFSMVAGDFLEVYGKQPESWDCVATCFFLDTAHNVIEYVDIISRILKPGGVWVNFGPLLYHYAEMEDEVSVELTWEELKALFVPFGLRLDVEKHGLESPYVCNQRSMLQMRYRCVQFTCTKAAESGVRPARLPTVAAHAMASGRHAPHVQPAAAAHQGNGSTTASSSSGSSSGSGSGSDDEDASSRRRRRS